ncbi:MAG: 3-isopropylmalate dehydratase small subunit [Dehalococcoidia bacterium]|jgi:3-isopropylmalate/(R)-2-methylmalate dehydratase small subunit|nr:3-isopropylmalate dehydratase small subunit [Dehalococcoidia bacterium]MDW8008168.1 3-isopropylmalate dehydratase small subunit [Chloroflexota bacterium]
MEPFRVHTGIVAPLDRSNVDTDQIMPKQFLKRIERTGFGEFVFYDWRFLPDGSPNPEFELNRPGYRGATILVTGRNFGCGSSREHAVWGLKEYGFRAIIAPSFADIFFSNCIQNGVLPARVEEEVVRRIIARALEEPGYRLTVDLEQQLIYDEEGLRAEFDIDPSARERLLNGWDDIALTLLHEEKIRAFEERRPRWLPRVAMERLG